VLVFACGSAGKEAPRASHPEVEPSSQRPLVHESVDRAPGPAAAVDAGVRTGAATREPEYRHDDYFPKNGVVDIRRWSSTHGVVAALHESECWDARDRVGVPPAPGLVCERSTTRPSKVTQRMYRLEGTRLRVVWEGVVATWANWLELTPILSDDGAELVVHERSAGSCERAFEEYREKEASGVRADFGPVLSEGCAARGVHPWSGDRYVKSPLPGAP
jgi:hypothetical protein